MSIATYGPKIFEVSSKKIHTFDGFDMKVGLNTETQDSKGNKPNTYIKGETLIPVNLTVLMDRAFMDIEKEIASWTGLVESKTPRVLTLGGKPLSKYRFLLKNITLNETVIDNNGKFLKAKLVLEFEEFVRHGSAKASAGGSSSRDGKSGGSGDLSWKRPNPNAEKTKKSKKTPIKTVINLATHKPVFTTKEWIATNNPGNPDDHYARFEQIGNPNDHNSRYEQG